MNAVPYVRILLLAFIPALSAGCSREARVQRTLTRADSYFSAGTYESAIIEYHNVLQLDPNNSRATERLARIWLARGASMRALPYLNRAHALAPTNMDVRRDLLRISFELGKWAETRNHAVEILARAPNDRDALVFLAAASRAPDHLQVLDQALRNADPTSAGYHAASALLMQRRDNLGAARTHLQRALAAEPKWPEIHSINAAFLGLQNEVAEAREEYQRASDLAGPRSEERVKYAEFLAQTGSVPAATACLEDATRQAADYVPAWRGLAEIALAERRFDAADRYLQNAYKSDPANYDGEITRARALLAKGEPQAAVDLLVALGRQYPGAGADKYQLGLAYLKLKDGPNAKKSLLNAFVQNPDNDDAALLLGQLELMSGNPEVAAMAMVQLLSVRPSLPAAQMLLLEALKTMGRLDGVVAHLRERVKAAPKQVELQRLLGLLLKYQNNYAEARTVLQRSLELSPGFFPVQAELIDLEVKLRNFDHARRMVRSLAAERPGSPAVCLLAARVYSAQGQWDEAESQLLQALALDPSYAAAYELLHRMLAEPKDRKVVVQRVDSFVAKRPDDFSALLVAGEVYMQVGADAKARDAYERSLVLRPKATVALNNLAYLYGERLEQPDRALELATQARQLDPRTPAIADTLGMIHYRRGDFAIALPLLTESASKQPANPEAQYHLGLCSQALGDKDAARAAYHRATMLPRDFADKRDAEKRLGELGGPPDALATAAPVN